jgi:predicted porin
LTQQSHINQEFNVRNLNRNSASMSRPGARRDGCGSKAWALSGVAAALIAATGIAQAQTTSATSPPAPADESLTWHGITLYGIVDVGLQYETHGAPFSDYFISGGSDIVQKNSNNPVFGVTSNPMSQSRIGLQGKESLHFLDFSGIFKLETFFNPASGNLTNALKSLAQNNGRALDAQSTNIDSSVAGQVFQQSFVGISSPTYGTLTFGRQNTTLADLVAKYDPQQVSYAFSLVGLSGTPAGGGDTQDRRLDDSIKYSAKFFDLAHFSVQYKFQNSTAQSYATGGSGEAFSAIEVSTGAEYAGASLDVFYTKIRDAISAGTLSATAVADLATYGLSSANSVSGTVSDNASYGVMGSYDLNALTGGLAPVTLFAAYQHITYMNPSIALPIGFDDLSGYTLGSVSNTAYEKADKILQVYWAGARYAITDQFTAAIAYYGEKQNAYATGADAGCSSVVSSACSGHLNVASISLDYHFTKRFDTYAGAMWSNVSHGLANGYLNTTMIDPTIGARFSF